MTKSKAIDLVKDITPPLLVQYANLSFTATIPATEAIFTIEPFFELIKFSRQCFVTKYVPVKLTFIISSQSLLLVVKMFPDLPIPALLTNIFMLLRYVNDSFIHFMIEFSSVMSH